MTDPTLAADLPTQEMTAALAEPTEIEHRWLRLPAERFQLVRLNALPAERETGLRPLRFISLERVERHSTEESFLRLNLVLPQQNTHKEINVLEVWADHQREEIRINTDLPLRTDPANRGLGRFMLAQAVQWGQKRWSDYSLASQPLLLKHSVSDAARLRRDHALQAQGFSVTYEDAVQMRAVCSAESLKELSSDWNENKVTLISTLDSAAMLQKADQSLHEKNRETTALNNTVERLTREDTTLRFTVSMLTIFAVFQAALLIWVATR